MIIISQNNQLLNKPTKIFISDLSNFLELNSLKTYHIKKVILYIHFEEIINFKFNYIPASIQKPRKIW